MLGVRSECPISCKDGVQDWFRVGDLVLLCDDTLTEDRNWPFGIITAVHPDPNDLVRVVEVKVRGKHYT